MNSWANLQLVDIYSQIVKNFQLFKRSQSSKT